MCPRGSHMHATVLLPGRIDLLMTKEKKPSWSLEPQPRPKTSSREQVSGSNLLKMTTKGPGPPACSSPHRKERSWEM